jgi:hypothetical protein
MTRHVAGQGRKEGRKERKKEGKKGCEKTERELLTLTCQEMAMASSFPAFIV